MNIYELLNYTVTVKKRFDLRSDFPDDKLEELDSVEDRKVYELIRNICSMTMNVKEDGVEFRPAFIFDGKRTYSIDDISESSYAILLSLDYQRLPVNVRARITDVLWAQKKKYRMAIIAAESYYELFNLIFKDDDYLDALKFIKRAISIVLQLNQTYLHNKYCQTVYDHLIRIDGLDTQFLSISLIEILLMNNFGDETKIVNIIDNILNESKDNPFKMERAFELKFKYKNKLEGLESAKSINVDMGNYFVDYGEQVYSTDKQGAIRSEHFLQKAIFLFRNNGEKARAEQTHRRLVEIQKDIFKSMTFHQQKIDVSSIIEKISKLMDGLSFEECIVKLSQITHFYTRSEGEKGVIDDLSKFPFSHMFGTNFVNQEGQTVYSLQPLDLSDPYKDLELLDLHINHKLFELEDWSGKLHLRFALNHIRENFNINEQSFDFILNDNAIIPVTRKNIIKKGICLAFDGDYYAALHILAPQTEYIFREIAKNAGALTVTLENDGSSKQKTLTTVFDLPELLDCYDNDIIFLFKGLLNEASGANIRNEIAHGIMEESKGVAGASIYFICAFIKLLVISSLRGFSMLVDNEKMEFSDDKESDMIKTISELDE